ncbi:hypothetical protein, partial [Pseudomonas sp. GTC 16482]
MLESKLKNIDNRIVDQSFREAIDEFIADTELRKERGYGFILHEDRQYGLLDLIALIYEGFDDFLGHYLSLESGSALIDSCWSTYQIRSDYFDHYIE